MYSIHKQQVDMASGFHVIELRDERGHQHFVQIAVGHNCCPACGAVYPKDNLGDIDPKAMLRDVAESLNKSEADVNEYAKKHGLKVK
jgi:uncharacterized protein (UPF0212 family)